MASSELNTPMSNSFKDKLRQIRDASVKRSAISQRTRTDADISRSEKTVRAFEFRESVEGSIEELAKNFQTEAPGFVLTRGFFEGKYMLALRLDEQLMDGHGRVDSYFSRLMFLLAPRAEDNSFAMQCRKTIRNRDLETTAHAGHMVDEDLAGFGGFIEVQFLAFAENYFGESSLTPPTSVPT